MKPITKPTHQCSECGALWILHESPKWGESWSLYSYQCGACCDNTPMQDLQTTVLDPCLMDLLDEIMLEAL